VVTKLTDRTAKDDFLVKHKQQGMTYKEIRRLGGFIEAESTLRGRYRTLTKSREARVRKPEWSEKDVSVISVFCSAPVDVEPGGCCHSLPFIFTLPFSALHLHFLNRQPDKHTLFLSDDTH
jgi:hypothetical protein